MKYRNKQKEKKYRHDVHSGDLIHTLQPIA